MVQINFALKEVNCKVVYYGPGMSGKTTNLEIVHEKAPPSNKGELTSIATEGDRTLFFDFMPLDLGNIAGMKTKFQLYTVPGQVYYNSTRKLVLQGSDGVVFVADSQASKLEENIESLGNLRENLAEYGKDIDDLPLIIQYNKRDLPNVLSIAELEAKLNPDGRPYFEAVATTGEGVFPTLKALAGIVLESLNRDRRRPVPGSRVRPGAEPAPAAGSSPISGMSPPDLSGPSASPAATPAATAVAAPPRSAPAARRAPVASSRPTARVIKRPRVTLEDDRSSIVMVSLLVVIILAAAGVILYSFNVI